MTFGALLRRYRLAAGLTQEELAERAQVSPRAIRNLERGKAMTLEQAFDYALEQVDSQK